MSGLISTEDSWDLRPAPVLHLLQDHTSRSLWKIPPYTQETARVEKTQDILVVLQKQEYLPEPERVLPTSRSPGLRRDKSSPSCKHLHLSFVVSFTALNWRSLFPSRINKGTSGISLACSVRWGSNLTFPQFFLYKFIFFIYFWRVGSSLLRAGFL